MDVVCERCKAEYEFDDALVSERGTTVKCTNCSHQFKIFRPTSESDAAKVWNLRRPDGTVIPFDSLAVLQKWILEGKVSKMDEISRAGEGWKSLGAIAELESFFATAELRASQNAPGRAGQRFPSMNGVRAPTPAPGTASRSNPAAASSKPPVISSPTIRPGGAAPPPPPPVALRAPSQGGAPASGLRAPSHGGTPPPVPTNLRGNSGVKPAVSTMVQIPPPPKMPAEMGPPSSPIPERHEPLVNEVERARPRSIPPKVELPPLPTLTTPPRDLVDDQAPTRSVNSDLKLPPRSAPPAPIEKRNGLGLGLVVGAVIAVIVVGVSWRMGVLSPTPTPATAPTTPVVDNAHRDAIIGRATERTRRYGTAAFDEAREELNTAMTLSPGDPVLTATRAEVAAAWSEMLSQQADDLEAQAALPGADASRLRAEADLLRRESNTRKERARSDLRAAEEAIGRVPEADRATVEARLADTARVLGEGSLAGHLEAARRGTPSAETSLYLALASTTDDPASATTGLRAALAADPQNQRARVALGRLLKRQGDAHGARELLDEGLRANAGHEALLALSRSLGAADVATGPDAGARDAGAPAVVAATTPAPTLVIPAPTAPTAPTGPTPTTTPGDPGHHTASAPTTTPGDPSGVVPQGYDRLVQAGDQAQHAGRSAIARERYQAALAARPTGAEALTGLGYVELDSGSVSAAISRFRQALAGNSRYSEAYIGLGEAYSHQRSYAQAVQAYQQYLDINPGGTRAEMARRQIESLQERISAARAPESSDADASTSP